MGRQTKDPAHWVALMLGKPTLWINTAATRTIMKMGRQDDNEKHEEKQLKISRGPKVQMPYDVLNINHEVRTIYLVSNYQRQEYVNSEYVWITSSELLRHLSPCFRQSYRVLKRTGTLLHPIDPYWYWSGPTKTFDVSFSSLLAYQPLSPHEGNSMGFYQHVSVVGSGSSSAASFLTFRQSTSIIS